MIGSMWCTDVRTHQSMYPLGYSIETHQDVRVDVRPNIGLRIYTEKDALDGETVELVISKHTTGSEPQFYCNGVEVCAVRKDAKNQGIAKNELVDHTQFVVPKAALPFHSKLPSAAAAAAANTPFEATASVAEQREKEPQEEETNDKALYHRRNSHVVVFSDELSFTAHQFAFILLLMGICYYFGKFSCQCS
ncbi:hypothetical protein MUCCIDRAFT_157142 [Mucor lusitanicus CBS 277.49]|uniref:Uncharacterized protein n=1 Tax=Mucor lusitanicus CBS 277.49 TaxID=747725 RepID=A0A168HT77_MUCCL|nr:hypothetical protein MUCCIDRAFT_157142 [Mucor lusitanicus CBS 277.49]